MILLIPYSHQFIDESDIQAVVDVLHSEHLTTGPKIAEFEEAFAEYVGSKYAVAVSSCTAALHLSLLAAGIGPGDEVITSPITFAATANAILYVGARPVFADIDAYTYNIDMMEIRRKITGRTKAILPVHFAGLPCDLQTLYRISDEYGVEIIEDGAHAVGAEYCGKKIGSFGPMTCFSFHPVKPITTGEGGMITTNDEAMYQALKELRSHGITRDRSKMTCDDGPWFYEQQQLGYNYRMTDFQAALGLSQLSKADQFLRRREEIVARYNEAFMNLKDITIPPRPPNTRSSWHLYVVQVAHRKAFFDALHERDIGAQVHYLPVYLHPYYQARGYEKGLCPNAEAYYERCISLPLFAGMTDEQVEQVIEATIKFFGGGLNEISTTYEHIGMANL